MKSKKKNPFFIAVLFFGASVVIILLVVLGIERKKREKIIVTIPIDNLSQITAYCQGLGPKKLDYRKDPEAIIQLIEMVSGEYEYVKDWSTVGMIPGGVNIIKFYYWGQSEPVTLYYADGLVAAPGLLKGHYDLYQKKTSPVSFDNFEEYLFTYGW